MKTANEYKKLTIREFTKAADVYETDKAGIYEMCRKDYPYIKDELDKIEYKDLLDCGCGTGAMISLLHENDSSKNYTGLDITPRMIKVANEKKLQSAQFIVGDCEEIPFEDESFDVIICTNSFHHYPNPQRFFDNAYRVLRKGGYLILQDYTASKALVWFLNHTEMPIANVIGHGDVAMHTQKEVSEFCQKANLQVEKLQASKGMRLHLVAKKTKAY